MRRNSIYRTGLFIVALFATMISSSFSLRAQQALVAAQPCYQILSSSANEIVVHIHPDFTTSTVSNPSSSENYISVNFTSSTDAGLRTGEPAELALSLAALVPDHSRKIGVEIISSEVKSISGLLAPVATAKHSQGEVVAQYIRDFAAYGSHRPHEIASAAMPRILRSACVSDLIIHPVIGGATGSITLVTDLVVKITIPQSAKSAANSGIVTTSDEDYFHSMTINGENTSLYRSAASEFAKGIYVAPTSYKTTSVSNAQWLQVNTTDEGVYHITAADLASAGISTVDPTTISLYGYGAAALPEPIDSATGELRECAVEVQTNSDGSFSEARFYAPGPAQWTYVWNADPSQTKIYNIYHLMNPYSTAGHYLLKVGGAEATQRIGSSPDIINDTIIRVHKSTVQTVALHESELAFAFPNISREFVGEQIPVGRPVTVSLPPLPGYTSDSTVVRPAFNAHAQSAHSFSVTINNTSFGSVQDYETIPTDGSIWTTRDWGTEFPLAPSFGTPTSITLSANDSTELSPSFWLDFAEVFYRRTTSMTNGQLPFILFGDATAYDYAFTDGANTEVWEVTNPLSAVNVGGSSQASFDLLLKGNARSLRRFYAFTPSQLKSATITLTAAPALRSAICTTGAQEIIIVPQAMLDQANKLAALRRIGGQATEPISVAVVTVEDIYREFGYGATDATAIRDFIIAALHHSTIGGGTVPSYFCLFGGGHVDYQNRTTTLPVNIPIYETWYNYSVGDLRTSEPTYDSDDGFYAQTTESSRGQYNGVNVAIGRVAVLTPQEGDDYVAKVAKYETSSDEGAWRSKVSFVCDDRYHDDLTHPDPLNHIQSTEEEVAVTPDRLSFVKIYGQAYPGVITSSGLKKPEMETAIIDAFNSGSVILSYVGHGNPIVWADESILTVPSTINKFTNFNKLAFVTTATCDFSRYDDYAAKTSGGVQMMKKPDGGAIGLLATCREVIGDDSFAPQFYQSLFSMPCGSDRSSLPSGTAYVFARATSSTSSNRDKYFILGDPSQRLLIPRQYVAIDSINGVAYSENDSIPRNLEALSEVTISGHISTACDGSDIDTSFNGSTTVTLNDAPSYVSATSTFTQAPPITDTWQVDGPILYSGVSTVASGRFHSTFVVSKDIKFDSAHAKISMLAYSNDIRSALGVVTNVRVLGIDTSRISSDENGPSLKVYIGSRAFHSGDVVPANSTVIVDVNDISGLNTSSSGIGHSFSCWTDDSTAGMTDLSAGYVATANNFTTGTSTDQLTLPLGTHILNVRAFDALGNPTHASVEFTAVGSDPYQLLNVTVYPNPVRHTATFTFEQPAAPQEPVDVTLDLYSVTGQHVRSIGVPGVSSNLITIPFDGEDASGAELINGAYLYRLTVLQRLNGVSTSSGGTFIVTHN